MSDDDKRQVDPAEEADHDDPVPVALPQKVITPSTVIQLTLTQFWSLLGALAVVGGGLATYVHSNTAGLTMRMDAIEVRVGALEQKLDRLIAWVENRDKFAGAKSIADLPGHKPAPDSPPSPAPPDAPAPPSFPLKTIPSDVKPIAPPVCVEKTLHRRFACDDASECYPTGAFTAEHFAKVMAEAGVESPGAQICAAKR